MAVREYVDISHHNAVSDWPALKNWSASFDGQSQLCAKLTEGTGFVDPDNFSAQALTKGFDVVMPYHYARPDLGNTPQAEAAYFLAHLPAIRQSDYLMLDYEGLAGVPNSKFPASWALSWLQAVAASNRVQAGHVVIYSYKSFLDQMLAGTPALAAYPLIYAWYTSVQPPAPLPWKSYLGWQYTANGSVPGVSSPVDINRWYGPAAGPDLNLVKSLLQQALTELEK